MIVSITLFEEYLESAKLIETFSISLEEQNYHLNVP